MLKIVKIVRQHETKKIMPRAMKEILDYVGIHVSDAKSVRLFEWRARKKRQTISAVQDFTGSGTVTFNRDQPTQRC